MSDINLPALQTLRRQYFALVPAYLLLIPDLPPAAQEWLADNLVDSPLPAPEEGYQRSFWKRALPALEAGAGEDGVEERVYEVVAELMATPPRFGEPPQSFKTFLYGEPERAITLREEQVAVQAGTTGLRTWTAALHLAHHVLHSSSTLFSSATLPPVVELGAGTGFLSILLAQLGADVITTDLGDEYGDDEGQAFRTPLGRLKANISLNELHKPPKVRSLDWADASASPDQRTPAWAEALEPVEGRRRVVMAADVIYDPDLVPLLVDAIDVLAEGSHAVLAATVRNEDTFELFLDECASRAMRTQLLSLAPMDASAPTFWDTALDAGTRVQIVHVTPSRPPTASSMAT
ncbi:hypothetical protein CC85DRAFT_284964 [Cutaneotrichosporon oleaginosum]|uniref:S-adenosyl-L-methionine-dependent methyltransferase n=1 Tax=Cutaneotrichosporon oleaginosum TaxID=879819 RepID=A0A0J0XPJ5_9TREE|nr:uncharacterized protein CC85DRAFT_284964 [Cutaneotrichosporon oleaginosum]KLT42997.1 hypothetical protein CC85DRAFT_284964 [Cutaneotrichosporon oleaginosum]TXT11795.1 hypothetical protein COLE_02205 [Cutaneotrichosporon oleaginosum]